MPTADNYVRQGVTTLLEGLDGDSPLPLRKFLDRVSLARISVNFGSFVGHGSIRNEVITSHMRDEASGVLDSVRETIAIGEQGGLPTQITHHKIIGTGNWGKSTETLRLMAEARVRGVDATIDQYPYTASSTGIQVLLPAWAQEGGGAEVRKRLADPGTHARILAAVIENIKYDRGGGDPANVTIASCSWNPCHP